VVVAVVGYLNASRVGYDTRDGLYNGGYDIGYDVAL
jgi:hypothetical protein